MKRRNTSRRKTANKQKNQPKKSRNQAVKKNTYVHQQKSKCHA